jgi:hypothetical protein
MLKRLWCEDEGVLTLEWILLTTLVVIGVISGLAAVRDALMHELAGVVGAIMAIDQSYSLSTPIAISVGGGVGCSPSVAGSQMSFQDTTGYTVGRATGTYGQTSSSTCTLSF